MKINVTDVQASVCLLVWYVLHLQNDEPFFVLLHRVCLRLFSCQNCLLYSIWELSYKCKNWARHTCIIRIFVPHASQFSDWKCLVIKLEIRPERPERGLASVNCSNWGEWRLKEYKWKGSFPRGGADTFLLYVVPRFVMYTASALESWANLRKET